jgi:hypothetical protein
MSNKIRYIEKKLNILNKNCNKIRLFYIPERNFRLYNTRRIFRLK